MILILILSTLLKFSTQAGNLLVFTGFKTLNLNKNKTNKIGIDNNNNNNLDVSSRKTKRALTAKPTKTGLMFMTTTFIF